MKLFYLSGALIPSRFANVVHVMKMSQAFANLGLDVTLFGKGENTAESFSYYEVKNNFNLCLSRGTSGIKRLLNIILNSKRCDYYYGRDPLALYFCSGRGNPCIYESHQIYDNPIRNFATRRILKKFKKLVVISHGLKRDMLDAYPFLAADNVLVAPDGADLWPADYQTTLPKDWKGRSDSIQIGYTGSLLKGKGADRIPHIAKNLPHIDFHIIGGTTAQMQDLQNSAPDNVHFYGQKPHTALKDYLAACDILLAPYQENIHIARSNVTIGKWISPLKLFEYMAAKKPILCSDLPVIREVMSNQHNAILVPPDDINAWVTAIEALSKDTKLRETLARNAHRDLTDKYTWDKRAESILNFIQGH